MLSFVQAHKTRRSRVVKESGPNKVAQQGSGSNKSSFGCVPRMFRRSNNMKNKNHDNNDHADLLLVSKQGGGDAVKGAPAVVPPEYNSTALLTSDSRDVTGDSNNHVWDDFNANKFHGPANIPLRTSNENIIIEENNESGDEGTKKLDEQKHEETNMNAAGAALHQQAIVDIGSHNKHDILMPLPLAEHRQTSKTSSASGNMPPGVVKRNRSKESTRSTVTPVKPLRTSLQGIAKLSGSTRVPENLEFTSIIPRDRVMAPLEALLGGVQLPETKEAATPGQPTLYLGVAANHRLAAGSNNVNRRSPSKSSNNASNQAPAGAGGELSHFMQM